MAVIITSSVPIRWPTIFAPSALKSSTIDNKAIGIVRTIKLMIVIPFIARMEVDRFSDKSRFKRIELNTNSVSNSNSGNSVHRFTAKAGPSTNIRSVSAATINKAPMPVLMTRWSDLAIKRWRFDTIYLIHIIENTVLLKQYLRWIWGKETLLLSTNSERYMQCRIEEFNTQI